MKKVLKIILVIFCWGIGLILLTETIKSFSNLDPWGLGFTFYTLPVGAISVSFLVLAIILTKQLISKKSNNTEK